MPPKEEMYWSCLPMGSPSDVDLDVAGLLGQNLARDEFLIQRVQRAQQGHRETAGRAQARARPGYRTG